MEKDGDIFFNNEQLKVGVGNPVNGIATKELRPSAEDDLVELKGNQEWIITKLNNLEGATLIMNSSLEQVERTSKFHSKELNTANKILSRIEGVTRDDRSDEFQIIIASISRIEDKVESLQTRMNNLETVMLNQCKSETKSKKKQKKKPVKEQNDTQDTVGEKTTDIGDVDCSGSDKGCDKDYIKWSNAKKRRMRKLKVKKRNEEIGKQEGQEKTEKGVDYVQEVNTNVAKEELNTEIMVHNNAYASFGNEAIDKSGNGKEQDKETLDKDKRVDCCSEFYLQMDQTKDADDRREQNKIRQSKKYNLLYCRRVPFLASFAILFALLSFPCVYLALNMFTCLSDNT